MGRILADQRRGLDGGVADELSAEQVQVPGPAVSGVGGGVDAEKAAPAAHVRLQRVLSRRSRTSPVVCRKTTADTPRSRSGREAGRVLGRYHRQVLAAAMSRTAASAAGMESCRNPRVRGAQAAESGCKMLASAVTVPLAHPAMVTIAAMNELRRREHSMTWGYHRAVRAVLPGPRRRGENADSVHLQRKLPRSIEIGRHPGGVEFAAYIRLRSSNLPSLPAGILSHGEPSLVRVDEAAVLLEERLVIPGEILQPPWWKAKMRVAAVLDQVAVVRRRR